MEMLSTDSFIEHWHFTQVGPSYQRNQQRRRFAKCARHHAGRFQNQAATTVTETPPQHPVEEPDEQSDGETDAELSSLPSSPPVVCFLYRLSTTLLQVCGWGTRSRPGHQRHSGRRLSDNQRKAADPAPSGEPLNVQGSLPLHSVHEEEKAKILGIVRKVNKLSEIAHLYKDSDAAVEWFGKNIKYKGHQEAGINARL